jgi:hypothetical protein
MSVDKAKIQEETEQPSPLERNSRETLMHTCDNTLASRQCQLSQALKGLLYCTDRECLAAACRVSSV